MVAVVVALAAHVHTGVQGTVSPCCKERSPPHQAFSSAPQQWMFLAEAAPFAGWALILGLLAVPQALVGNLQGLRLPGAPM